MKRNKIQKFNEFLNFGNKIEIDKIMWLIEKAERTPLSNPDQIAEGKAYKEVVSIGEKVIPILIERLDYSGIIWFKALRILTGEEVDKDHRGKVILCREDWKNWAEKNIN